MADELFDDIARQPTTGGGDEGPPRYETANRTQVELTPTDLEALLPAGHAARLVWRFVEGLDLTTFYAAIKAREGGPGRTPIDPKILIALWLYATIDGVGSAREVDRLCYAHDAYRWLRGGVSINYHTLSDFRGGHQAALDALLTQSITVLMQGGIVTLARVAHDGTRVRGSAGTGSFRREATLQACAREARKQVERTAKQTDATVSSQQAAAQHRAAVDRLARVDEALAQLPAIQATRDRQKKRDRTRAARASTTDPDARIMKMADGGYRPGYNVHFATDMDGGAIVGVDVTNVSADQGEFVPILEQVAARTGRWPTVALVDGGIATKAGITTLASHGVTVYAPVPSRNGQRDRFAPVRGDSDTVVAWRQRMATDEAKAVYRQRGSVAERVNADTRTHRTLQAIGVRGLAKVHTWVLWIAVAHNLMRAMKIIPHLMM
jgi:transposase